MYNHQSSSTSAYSPYSMSISGIQGHILEVTVVGCSKLKDTEWISRQDPYVCVEYASTKFRTRTCTDGGKNPSFQEKFVFTLIEGLRELNVIVWNSNTLTFDDFIGSGKVQLQKVLSQGYDDSPWSLQTKTGRYAGEVRLIMHYAGANLQKPPKNYAPSAPPSPYVAPHVPQSSSYYAPPPPATSAGHYPPQASAGHYQPQASAAPYPPPHSAYPPPPSAYPPPSPYHSYPPDSSAYPPSPYPPQPAAYPPQPYPPPSGYPPSSYPPSSQPSPFYPPGPYPGMYPPPPH